MRETSFLLLRREGAAESSWVNWLRSTSSGGSVPRRFSGFYPVAKRTKFPPCGWLQQGGFPSRVCGLEPLGTALLNQKYAWTFPAQSPQGSELWSPLLAQKSPDVAGPTLNHQTESLQVTSGSRNDPRVVSISLWTRCTLQATPRFSASLGERPCRLRRRR